MTNQKIALRELKEKDAKLMLEWMHDKEVVAYMDKNFNNFSLQDCNQFIKESWGDNANMHFAIVDEKDNYLGTVSLKNICLQSAEFAITIRKCVMGKEVAKVAMKKILSYGFNDMKLEKIYWYVFVENKRAIRFYDKNGYCRVEQPEVCHNIPTKMCYWYEVTREHN